MLARNAPRLCAAAARPVYAPPADFGERVKNIDLKIVDSTLREGEQFDTADFTTQDRVFIAKMLDRMGVDYIEMINPVASDKAMEDCRRLAELNLKKSKILTHVRCDMRDVRAAVESGVDGVNMYMATSEILVAHSHKKGIDEILRLADEAITYVQKHGLEVRFSCEDTFRSNIDNVLKVYTGVCEMGVDRIGIADTVGIATPLDTYRVVKTVREAIPEHVGIEFHAHDDTGCCLPNALMAVEAGATHIDTCVLGIGERNGIVPLGAFLARLYTINKDAVMEKYNIRHLNALDKFVSRACQVPIPFNNCVTGSGAFTHKAGVHTKAVMSNPGAYEVLAPEDFGVERRVNIRGKITGWNAIKARAQALQLDIPDEQIQIATNFIKNHADSQKLSDEAIDTILIQLSSGPRISRRDFMAPFAKALEEGQDRSNPAFQSAAQAAVEALHSYQTELARLAIASLPQHVDHRPYAIVRLTGHIFDNEVLNRTMDICVESKCDFDLVNVTCAKRNEDQSSADVKLLSTTASAADVEDTVAAIEGMARERGCTVLNITDAAQALQQQQQEAKAAREADMSAASA